MSHHTANLEHNFLTRRELLNRVGMGFGSLALGHLLGGNAEAAASRNPLTMRSAHFEAKAKRVVHLFMTGGPSQVDTFDPKPEADFVGNRWNTVFLSLEKKRKARKHV